MPLLLIRDAYIVIYLGTYVWGLGQASDKQICFIEQNICYDDMSAWATLRWYPGHKSKV